MGDGIELFGGGAASSGGAPSGSAGGDLTGTYPNPTIKTSVALGGSPTTTTQTAADNSTKIATTAYVDTLGALKANLASPTFTGTPTLPTGTVASTQSAGDSSTKVATTAFVAASAANRLQFIPRNGTVEILPNLSLGCTMPNANSTYGIGANVVHLMRFQAPAAGTVDGIYFPIATGGSGNVIGGMYDCGASSSGNVTKLADSGSTALAASATWQLLTWTAQAVTAGQHFFAGIMLSSTQTVLRGILGGSVLTGPDIGTIAGISGTHWTVTNSPGSFAFPSSVANGSLTDVASMFVCSVRFNRSTG